MLQLAVDGFVYQLLSLNPDAQWTQVLHFFIYDSVKIFLLLFFMITVLGCIRSYLPDDKIKKYLSRQHFFSYFVASCFGAFTPFCSCSSIPLFLSFLKTGVPLGVTFAFLLTSPIINEYLVVLMLGFFGWKITLVYILSGIFIGMSTGMMIAKLHLDDQIEHEFFQDIHTEHKENQVKTFRGHLQFGLGEATSIVKKIWLWVFVGVGIGALIHNYVPQETMHVLLDKTGVLSVPLAVVLGVPIYGSCAAIVPIAVVLFQKGLPLGTALAFMMAISALSLPEAVMLRRAMKLKLILVFFSITTASIIVTGYFINAIQPLLH